MKKIYTLLSLVLTGFTAGFGQFSYGTSTATIVSGTYTDLGTTGAAISTNSSGTAITYDDDNSAIQQIGFSFNYNGTAFTTFILNTNGFIKLGSTPTASPGIYTANSTANTETNMIYPMNLDLDGTAGTSEYRVATTGTAPNRVCTIQFKNVFDFNATSSQFASMNFQIKLYETTNTVEFIYGTFTGGAGADGAIFTHVGLKGSLSSNTVNFTKASSTAWTAAATILGAYVGNAFNIRKSVLPTSGYTLRFQTAAVTPNNLGIAALYVNGKVAVNNRDTIRVAVSNFGAQTQTNKVVSLAITGAAPLTGSVTITSIDPGATQILTLGVWTPTAVGTNTLTVTLPPDDSTSNDTRTASISSTINQQGTYTAGPVASLGFSGTTAEFVQRINIAAPAAINQVSFAFVGNAGVTYRAVIYNNSGTGGSPGTTPLWTSGDLTSPTTTSFVSVPVAPVVNVVSGSYYIGIQQTTTTVAGIAGETENPVRTGNAFYKTTGPWIDFSPVNNFKLAVEAQFATALPVTFTNFTGNKRGNVNELAWITANETNNVGFEIERSADGRNFTKIASVPTKAINGNSNQFLSYTATDAFILAGTNHYRLKQIDKDGKFNYSTVVTIAGNKSGKLSLGSVYPNPAVDVVNLQIATPNTVTAQILVMSTNGKIVGTYNKGLAVGDNLLTIPVQNLAKGTYFIKVIDSNGEYTNTVQFVK